MPPLPSMMALFHRDATGEGQWIDVPCWQATVNTSKLEMAAYTYVGIPFSRLRANVQVGLEPLPCNDGYIYTLWAADCPLEGACKHAARQSARTRQRDLRYARRPSGKRRHAATADPRSNSRSTTSDHLVTEGQRLGLTIGPVHTVAQAAHHPHLRARGAFVEIDHPVAGRFEYPRSLVQMTATPPESIARAAARRA